MSNPILNDKFLERAEAIEIVEGSVMTVNGTIQATAILGCLLLIAANIVWSQFDRGYNDMGNMLTYGGAIVGFVLALIIAIKRSKCLIPVYAVCEGLALGGISFLLEAVYKGIVMQAVGVTFVTFFAMLFMYRYGIIVASNKFKSVIFVATASIASVYLIDIIGHFFGYAVPFISVSDNSNLGIIVTGVIAIIAALNLIIDFDFIEKGSKMMLPKDYEWYGAFGLMITIVWLYLEILKFLIKLRSRK